MLALIRNWNCLKFVGTALLLSFAAALGACTKDPAPLINDPHGARETALPWNEQQKWEREGEAAALTQERRY